MEGGGNLVVRIESHGWENKVISLAKEVPLGNAMLRSHSLQCSDQSATTWEFESRPPIFPPPPFPPAPLSITTQFSPTSTPGLIMSSSANTRVKTDSKWVPPTEEQIDGYMQPDKPWNRGYMNGEMLPRDPESEKRIREMLRSGQITIYDDPGSSSTDPEIDPSWAPVLEKSKATPAHLRKSPPNPSSMKYHPTLTEMQAAIDVFEREVPNFVELDPTLKKLWFQPSLPYGSKEDGTYEELVFTPEFRLKMINDLIKLLKEKNAKLTAENKELRESRDAFMSKGLNELD